MARIYEYANSSKKNGYFLRGGTSGSNYTMQATDLGNQLFDRLDYEPGIVNKKRGSRVPSRLQWAMYDVGLLQTGENDFSGEGYEDELDIEDTEITEETVVKIREFVHSDGTDRSEIRELADILGVELEANSDMNVWDLSESVGQEIAGMFESKLEQTICTDDAPEWDITGRYTPEIPGPEGTTTFHIDVEHPADDSEVYTHEIYYVADEVADTPGLATMTKVPVDESRRVRIDRQRSRILEAMSQIPKLTGMYAIDPTEEVTCIILEEVLD